jgi:hypothetical protein
MARLRHIGAQREAGKIREEAVDLQRTMRHDERFQKVADRAIDNLTALERRAAEIVTTEDAVNCSLTSRSDNELRRAAAAGGHNDALAERSRRTAIPAAA